MALEGKVMEVLAEEQNTQDASLITGRLSNNSVVHFPGTPDMIGKLFMVKLTECKGFIIWERSQRMHRKFGKKM